jgi:acyl-CoA dehydrogenase
LVRRVVLAEELAYWDRGIGVATPGVGLPESIVIGSGTEEQKERFLGPFVKPERPMWASFALTEPTGGSDTAAFRTRARRDGTHWVLSGAKCFIGSAGRAQWILVQATTDPGGGRAAQRAFFVEKGTPGLGGFKVEKKMGLRAYESTSFSLEECRVPEANLLGGERQEKKGGDAYRETMGNLNFNRAGVAANAIGIARAALDEALAYARENDLLGDSHVRDRLEDASRKLRSAWLLVLKAAWLADQRKPNIIESSMCKVVAAETAQDIAAAGMEILGPVGGRGDHLIEKLYRDAKAMNIVEGTGQIQRMIVARQLVGLPR